ncbi:hypothetical protein PR003_g32683 [Phytophthora rubi]|uniref:RxLR effector protein n=1 Tax=Phytophthora rubi TaxID=129364 RepID=A0A6A4B0B2_9STRA|nr:hypothetical protein PR003_g32683 [Phytophthora rubi]
MKAAPTLITALIALGIAGVESKHVGRSLIMGGGEVPIGTKA